MSDPYDAFSSVVADDAPAPVRQPVADTDPYDAFSSLDGQAPPPPVQEKSPLDQSVDHLRTMLDDTDVTGQQIRDWYSSQGVKLSEDQSKLLEDRDQFIAANGKPMLIGIDSDHPVQGQPGIADNRPYSLMQGVIDGGAHVVSNLARGAQWAVNQTGANTKFGDDLQGYIERKQAEQDVQGDRYGNLVGEIAATLPVAFIAPEVEGASLLANGGRLAAQGAISGALTTHGDTPGEVIRDAAVGAVAAPVLGTAARGLRAVAANPRASTVAGREVLDAADQLSRDGLNVRPLPADVGGAASRRMTGGLNQGFVGGEIIGPRAMAYADNVAAARDRAANSLAPVGEEAQPLADVGAGLLDDAALGGYRQRARTAANAAYTAAENLGGDPVIQGGLPNFARALAAKIADLRSVPNSAANPNLRALEAIEHDITTNGYTASGLRRLRTELGRQLDATNPDSREIAGALRQPLSQDIDDALRAQGHDQTADMYRAADAGYAQSRRDLEDINNIIGKDDQRLSPEKVAGRLTALARGNGDGALIGRVLDTLQPEQAQRVRASFIANLGRAKPGAQTAQGDAFSFETFLTNWQRENFSDSAKAALIPDPQVRADLENIARLSQGARAANGSRNNSNSGGANNVMNMIHRLGLRGATIGSAGLSLIPEGFAAAALSSPTLARAGVRLGEIRPAVRAAQGVTKAAQKAAPPVAGYLMDLPRPGDEGR